MKLCETLQKNEDHFARKMGDYTLQCLVRFQPAKVAIKTRLNLGEGGFRGPAIVRLHQLFGYPLVMTNSLLLKIAIEIVDFPMKNGDCPLFFVCLPEGIFVCPKMGEHEGRNHQTVSVDIIRKRV